MSKPTYPARRTAYLAVEPHNSFRSAGGYVESFIKPMAGEVGLLDKFLVKLA